nr:MAG TPA: hypothetical protein [Caudoviricetes sp.]
MLVIAVFFPLHIAPLLPSLPTWQELPMNT